MRSPELRDPELVLQTTGAFVEIEVIGSNQPDEYAEYLVENYSFIYARNQDGLVLRLSTDMDSENLVPEAITAAPYVPSLHVGHRGNGELVLGEKRAHFFKMDSISGETFYDVVKSEPFDALLHVDLLERACAHTATGLDASLQRLSDELQKDGGITMVQAITLAAHLRDQGITFDFGTGEWQVPANVPGLSAALGEAGVKVAIREIEANEHPTNDGPEPD